ncbi:hypothetical protein BJV74DRAFT_869348 [Russula compacta]|nr:hypothetical protein BJV74DRAFT_869348 [Russula compacta]
MRSKSDVKRDRCVRHVFLTASPSLSRALSNSHQSSILTIKQLLYQRFIPQHLFDADCQGLECWKACCTSA